MLSCSDAEAIGRFQNPFGFSVPIHLKRRGVEAKLVMQAGGQPSHKPDAKLIAVLADAQRWISDLTDGRAASVRGLARQINRDAGDVSRSLPLAFLESAIIEAIVEGRQRQLAGSVDDPSRLVGHIHSAGLAAMAGRAECGPPWLCRPGAAGRAPSS